MQYLNEGINKLNTYLSENCGHCETYSYDILQCITQCKIQDCQDTYQ